MCVSRYFAKGNLAFHSSYRSCSHEGKDLTPPAHSPRGLVACLRGSGPRQKNVAIWAGSDCHKSQVLDTGALKL